MYQDTTPLRRGLAALLLASLGVIAAPPALGANDTCKANGFHITPSNQNNQARFDEYNAANNYARTVVHLGIDKPLDAGAVASWAQSSGPTVVLDTGNPRAPSFAAPDVGPAGATLQFTLTITCPGPGGATGSDVGTVSIIDVNRPPVAYASAAPSLVYEGDTVTLHATAPTGTPVSSDPDGDALFYAWSQVATPGVPGVTLSGAGTATASFVAPINATGDYTLQFQLTVRDRATSGLTATAPVMVNVSRSLPPIARLTCPDTVDEGGTVVLDGSASADPYGTPLTYAWVQNTGSPEVQVGAETGSIVQFTAPALSQGQDGFLEFWLTVSSGSGSDLATCWVQVADATPPVLTLPADMVVDADSASGKVVSFDATAVDAVDGPVAPAACAPASGSTFPLAAAPAKQKTSTVTCTAHDSAARTGFPDGNVATGSFNVTVRDITPPAIDVPGSVGVEATGPDGAVATFDATTTDAVDGPGLAACAPASGSLFALGTTGVTCAAGDQRENAATPVHFDVTVHDTTAPVITAPMAVVAEATGSAGAVVQFTATASDVVDGDVAVTCLPASGSTFALGDTAVTCDAIDAHGNSTAQAGHVTSATFVVTVHDTTPPDITVPAPITAEATGPGGTTVTYSATAFDLVDGNVAVDCTPASGTTFPLTTTTVTCDAVDSRGNSTAERNLTKTFTITVQDTTPPALTVPAAIVEEATGPAGAVVHYTASAMDLVDGSVIPMCTPTSGKTFGVQTSTVTCIATDAHGNSASAGFSITVQDTTPPTLTLPANIAAEATGPAGANVGFSASADDIVSGAVAVGCSRDSGDSFGLGTTTVSCSAHDAAGNIGTGSFTVTVRDTTPPLFAPYADVYATASGNSQATVHFELPTASDLVDGVVGVNCNRTSDSSFVVGATTVTCTAADGRSPPNAATMTFRVHVTYAWSGFFRPVDNLPLTNTVKAGSAIPVKFSLGGNQGLSVMASGYPKAVLIACQTGAPLDAIEETVTAGGSSLSYDALANQYVYVWKSEKAWAGTCRQLQVKLADGTPAQLANFSLTR